MQARAETNVFWLIVLTIFAVSIGGLVQIVPLFFQHSTTEPVEGLKPYSALRLAGRDVYIREGCNTCHSQMIRPFRAETERYGHYSTANEYIYDYPFLWGSKRTGPDLHRVGGRYSDAWHKAHLINPRDVVPESVMPAYPWLLTGTIDGASIQHRLEVLQGWPFNVPYSDEEIANAPAEVEGKSEMDAMIAYLQGMGLQVKMTR
ncbi:MAG: cytochrome-c oxidase, cbb3-type subunit II [Pseudomonadota bacterium]|nr:cytochrome-c oxidase, cbb3-type subunit II [Pseudomonadota bacterium]